MADEKLEKKVYALPGGKEFIDEMLRLNPQQLEARISNMQKHLEESEEHRENNGPLKRAKDEVKELSGPYNGVRKAVKLKTKFIIATLKEKGKV